MQRCFLNWLSYFQLVIGKICHQCDAISIGYKKIFGTKPNISLKKQILDEFIKVDGVPDEGVGVLMATERFMLIGAKKIASLLMAAGMPVRDE